MPLGQSIGLDLLAKYFHLPINDVAKELGVCATVLKKICRKNGIPRWPHRKIKSLDKMVSTLEVAVAKNPEDSERIKQEIVALRSKKEFLMQNPNVLAAVKPATSKKSAKNVSNNDDDSSDDQNVLDPTTAVHPMAAALFTQLSYPMIPTPIPVTNSVQIQTQFKGEKVTLGISSKSAFAPVDKKRKLNVDNSECQECKKCEQCCEKCLECETIAKSQKTTYIPTTIN